MRGTLRMPNAMVTASKLRSGSGSASALASTNSMSPRRRLCAARLGALAADREHVGVDVGDGDAGAGAGLLGHPQRHVAGAAGDVEQRERPIALFVKTAGTAFCGGLTAVTSASFQARCRPPDIRSFIRS